MGPWIATQMMLHRHLTQRNLKSHLQIRPTVESLEGSKIVLEGATTAAWVCPSIRPKLKFFEELKSEEAISKECK
jgi:hypothetical protein